MTSPELTVVVPVYNEAENFPRFHASLQAHVRTPYRLLVVYDHENDTTLPVARALAATDPTIELVKNEGKGVLGALKTGLKKPERGAVLVTMADCSDDHAQADAMFALYQDGFHVVSASRYSKGGEQRGGPLLKSAMSRAAGVSLHLLGGVATSDPTNNYKLYAVDFLQRVEIESTGGFEVALELTVKATRMGLRVCEIGTVWTDRVAGQSNFQLRKWLPRYLRWYAAAMQDRAGKLLGKPS
jgi:dolichol-phosphate mannosyltransferase